LNDAARGLIFYETSNNVRELQWEKKIAHLVIVCPGRDVTPKLSDLAVIL
jgi:transcriptional regulator with AAA-type ATPase domain